MLRAKLGLISMAMRKPMKCNNTPKLTKTKADAHTATNTFWAVIDTVRTEAVGPATHISCINGSGKFVEAAVSLTHSWRENCREFYLEKRLNFS
jgi:hypothetical protein